MLCNANSNANITFHLGAESPKLHNFYFVACRSRLPLAGKRQTQDRMRKTWKEEEKIPQSGSQSYMEKRRGRREIEVTRMR